MVSSKGACSSYHSLPQLKTKYPNKMKLSFNLNEKDLVAFTEQLLHSSQSHQKIRKKAQWTLPLIFLTLLLFMGLRGTLQTPTAFIFGGVAVAWFFLYPKRFDTSIKKHAINQIKESSYAKSFGQYELSLDEKGIQSSSPLGEAFYPWDGVDRVELLEDYLYIFLAGPMGYPIRVSEIGSNTASEALSLITTQLKKSAKP